jgi:2-dehydro-3-deoxyphosphogluconate aldolase/(4S)-4-hydroxy-2-oxoglutarate aldolase
MKHDRMEVLSATIAQGVIPVFNHPDTEICIAIIRACIAGGARCIEFTNRSEFAVHTFLEVSRYLAGREPEVILGAGSVVDSATAGFYIAGGAIFVVGPNFNVDIARTCNRRKIAYVPGCGSVSEISDAEEMGCEIVKVFPGSSVGGPEFVKAILAPMPWTKIMPTGGVEATEASLRAWFDAGVVACGIGSSLISNALVDQRDYAGITERVRKTLDIVKTIRNAHP